MNSSRFSFEGRSDNGAEHDHSQNWVTRVPRPLHHTMGEDGRLYPWRLFEERVRTGPFGLSRFPRQPFSPIRFLILDGGGRNSSNDGINPRLRRFIQDSPPRIRNEWNVLNEEPPSLTDSEFKAAMKRLKKQVYQGPGPSKRDHRRGIFGRKSAKNEIEIDRMPADCSICLEAFVPNEHVLVTPCKHMFHDGCITPWVKSHGKCPICRLSFWDRDRPVPVPVPVPTRSSNSNNNNSSDNDNDNEDDRRMEEEVALQVLALIRAMEEAFNWVTLSRAISFD